jgi:hypothetical protein
MTQLTTQQLAEVLIGIARAQQAIIDAIESSKAGFTTTHLAPLLHTAAKTRNTGYVPGLADLPARILISCQTRTGPDAVAVERDLNEMLERTRKLA